MTLPQRLRILLVEDVATDAQIALRELKRAGIALEGRIVDTEETFLRELTAFAPHIILSDFSMPQFDGMSALSLARELAPDTPFIFISGTIGEEYAIRALRNGASDYVLKTNLIRLPPAVERALQEARDRAARLDAERALAVEREKIASIVTSLPDVVWSADFSSHRVLYVSPNVTEIYGQAPDEFLARDDLWMQAIHRDDQRAVTEAWRELLAGGRFDVEYRIVRPDGTIRWINDRGRLIRNDSGAPERIDRLARDVTEQVAHRQRIARLSQIRDFIGSINAALIRIRERDALFTEVCRIASSIGGLRSALVGMLDEASGDVQWVVLVGESARSIDRSPASVRPETEPGQGIVGQSLRTGEPAVWNDIANDPDVRLRKELLADGARSAGSFPLQVEGRSIGVLVLHSSEPGFFDDEEIRLLGEVAANIGLALELISKQDRLNYLALYDALTGLPNRTLFRDRLTQALEVERRAQCKLALMLFDIERFKAVNDTFGQHAGDRLLQQIAGGLRAAAGDINRVAHLGGDVFAIMIPSLQDAANVATVLRERAARILEEPFAVEGRELRLKVKAGIAVFPEDGGDADALFRNAEAALKQAKKTGDRYLFYAPHINARVAERMELEHDLRAAIERREFVLHYQPKVELESRRVVGLEALIRWARPGAGLVPPARLIPVLEQTGMILELGQWVIEEAIATYRKWCDRGMRAPRIAVNVSAVQLRQPDFSSTVRAAIAAGTQPCGLDLEVTESLLMDNMEEAIRKLREVREMGVGISLDDFGTGYSSLSRLARLPVDTLKIDRVFIQGMADHPDDTSIVTTIISLGRTLNRRVIAEGVETEEQARLLRLLRCDQMQGNIFSPPLPRERIEALIAGG
ncbi:MAG: EAL domain-containing protein [Betaproteobacteria bacterium]|nr:EAL domain-containing protein [Betaproteobacteria bacterium]